MQCCGAIGELSCAEGCVNFTPSRADPIICDCGHKNFRHRVTADNDRQLNDQLDQLRLLVIETNKKVDETSKRVISISTGLGCIVEDLLDPWCGIRTDDGSNSSGTGSNSTRTKSILDYYSIPNNFCMILGECDSRDEWKKNRIMNAHLWPNHTKGRGLNFLQLEAEEVNSERNFLRLHKSLEKAFDRHRIIFEVMWSPSTSSSEELSNPSTMFRLKVVILDQALKNEDHVVVTKDKKLPWSEIDGMESHWEFGSQNQGGKPFTRIIAQHMHTGVNRAANYDWIEPNDITEYRERALQLLRNSLNGIRGFGLDGAFNAADNGET